MHLLLPLLCFRQRNTLPAILEENFVFRYVFTHKDPKTSSGDSGLFERCGSQPQRYAHTFFHQGATVETALVNAEPFAALGAGFELGDQETRLANEYARRLRHEWGVCEDSWGSVPVCAALTL